MTLYMPPLARKKRVPERYNPDSFRVISTNAEDAHPKFSDDNIYPVPDQEQFKRGIALPDIYNKTTKVLPKEVPDYRIHRPHPNSCGFLRHNVRILNDPICSVYTCDTHSEQDQWWPSRISNEPLHIPPKTKDTIYREGYMRDLPLSAKGFTRFESNPHKNAAHGVVPVNFLAAKDGQKRIFQEKISFEHQYNCRKDPNYPIRNKRHGSFVWDQASEEMSRRFIEEQKKYEKTLQKPTNETTSEIIPDILPPMPCIPCETDLKPSPATTQVPQQAVPPTSTTKSGTKEETSEKVTETKETVLDNTCKADEKQ